MRGRGRAILVLSDRLVQLEQQGILLASPSLNGEEEVGLFVGGTKEAERRVQLAKHNPLYLWHGERGLDKTRGHTVRRLRRAAPTSARSHQRPDETKLPPLVLTSSITSLCFSRASTRGWRSIGRRSTSRRSSTSRPPRTMRGSCSSKGEST